MQNLYSKTTENFKTNFISIDFLLPLNEKSAAPLSLLSQVLGRGCEKYGEMEKISALLEKLYGAEISIQTNRIGEYQSLSFDLSFLRERFLPDTSNISDTALDLLFSIIAEPITENGVFRADFVAQEKQNLIDKINAVINDKRRYALLRCRELMFQGEPYGVFELGREEAVSNIDAATLYAFYQSLLRVAPVFVSVIGEDGDLADKVKEKLRRVGVADERILEGQTQGKNAVGKVRYFEDVFDLSQSKLCMGFRLGKTAQQYPQAARLFNVVYGGSPTSKLFMNVRERLSLCYYCSSMLDPLKNIMFVSSGISADKFEAAKDEILRQLQDMREGKIAKEEFENAKIYLLDTFRSIKDSQARQGALALQQGVLGITEDLDEMIRGIQEVTVQQVVEVAKDTELDTIYLMKGKMEGVADA